MSNQKKRMQYNKPYKQNMKKNKPTNLLCANFNINVFVQEKKQ